MVAPLAAFGIWKAITWGAGIITAGYVAKKAVDKWGSTPSNDLANAGVSRERQYNDWQKWLQDKDDYANKKMDEIFKDAKDRKKQLEKENKNLNTRLGDKNLTPQEKAQILESIDRNNDEISQINHNLNEQVAKLHKSMEQFGTQRMTLQDFQNKGDSFNWGSIKNYSIIFLITIVVIMVIGLAKKLYALLSSAIK